MLLESSVLPSRPCLDSQSCLGYLPRVLHIWSSPAPVALSAQTLTSHLGSLRAPGGFPTSSSPSSTLLLRHSLHTRSDKISPGSKASRESHFFHIQFCLLLHPFQMALFPQLKPNLRTLLLLWSSATVVGRQRLPPPTEVLTPRTGEYVRVHGKGDRMQMELQRPIS